MKSSSKYIIQSDCTIVDALSQLNKLGKKNSQTLFVEDKIGKIIGTLTDGDIRRSLIDGISIKESVIRVANQNFRFLSNYNQDNVSIIHECKDRGIELLPILDSKENLVGIVNLLKQKSALPIDAVLMAGGKGERLRPLTLETPKPLLKIGEKAIIDRNVDRLIDYGVNNISVTVNYLKEKLIDHYSFPKDNGIKIECVAEPKFYGTIGALKLIKEFHNNTILVMNSDLLTDIDYEEFYLHFKEHEAMMSAAAVPYTISVPYGIFDLDGRNIKGVSEKPVYNYYANAGIYLIKKEALRYIPEGKVFNATDLIETLVAHGQKVIRYPLTGLWIDIGTPEEYRKAQELIKHLK